MRTAAKRVRITARLIEGESGHHVWAAKYDRALEDVFAIQDEITQKVAGWQPYTDAHRNETLLAGLRRHKLLPSSET